MDDVRHLIIMAKEPVPGKVKTRLAPPFSPEEAARLYRCLLEDTVDLVRSIPGARGGVAFSPASAAGWFRSLMPAGFLLLPQPRGGLGNRLEKIFQTMFAGGARAACLINSDGPDLPPAYLGEAFRLLEEDGVDAVFGPNPDGGYYLVGLRAAAPIFRGIPWSTGRVLEVSLAKARRAELQTATLPPWPDLDTLEDLREAFNRWRSGAATPPRRTFLELAGLLGFASIP